MKNSNMSQTYKNFSYGIRYDWIIVTLNDTKLKMTHYNILLLIHVIKLGKLLNFENAV